MICRVELHNRIHRNGEMFTDKEERYEKLIEDIAKKYSLIYHFDYGLVCKNKQDVIKLKIARKLLLNLGLKPSEILKVGAPKHMWIMEVYYANNESPTDEAKDLTFHGDLL